VRLHLFGVPQVEANHEMHPMPAERRCQLLALLALRRSWVRRGELASLFSPDQPTKLARSNLRKVLFRAEALEWATGLEVQHDLLRFPIGTDVVDFEQSRLEGRTADAIELYRGELLIGFDDPANQAWTNWLDSERDRLRSAWRSVCLARLRTDIDSGEAIALTARLLDVDPFDEAALTAHLLALTRDGQEVRAREVYQRFAARLADELGVAPSGALEATLVSVAAATTGAPRPTKLASLLAGRDDFVGRALEMRQIDLLLARRDCRLLNIVGPGGAGKSRLARQAMEQFGSRFAQGYVFVPLEDLTEPSEIGARLARDVGVPLTAHGDALSQVAHTLGEREVAIVLDNFEQLAADRSALTTLLSACPNLRLITTSRSRLALEDEWLLPIEGLPWPEPEDEDRAPAFDAVRLFVNAAMRFQPGLSVDANKAAIANICRQLEGLPLALEIAAGWTRVLSCEAIAAELRSGIGLLREHDAARPARHANIEAVFDGSWRLLSPIEREALARLSVFSGGFTAESARTVAGASLSVLAALSDKSLVRSDGTRLFLHPLMQQLAGVKLTAGGKRAAVERTHARHFHRLLDELRAGVERGERGAVESLDIDFENCRVAWQWAVANQEADALLCSTPTLLAFFELRSRFDDGLTLFGAAMADVRKPEVAALVGASMAKLEYRLGRAPQADARARRAQAHAEANGLDEAFMLSLTVRAGCCMVRGSFVEAKALFEQVRLRAIECGNERALAAVVDHLALIAWKTGQYRQSLDLSLQSLAKHRALGDSAGTVTCLTALASAYCYVGALQDAIAMLREGLEICEREGIVRSRVMILVNLTDALLATGDHNGAEATGKLALQAAEAVRDRIAIAHLHLHFTRIALNRAELATARHHLRCALRIAVDANLTSLQLAAIEYFAEIVDAQHDQPSARSIRAFAASHQSISAPEREEIERHLAKESAEQPRPWPGLGLDDLVQRVVAETEVAYEPLLQLLRSHASGPTS
jgi:predicted ATPase/DNA-binding SARP family transcriptional activator